MTGARLAQPPRSGLALPQSFSTAQFAKRPASMSGAGGPLLDSEPRAVLSFALFFLLGLLSGYLTWTLIDKGRYEQALASFDDQLFATVCRRSDFAKRSAEAEGWRHEGSLPVRASTLVLGHEVTRARPEGHAQNLSF